MIYCSEVTTKVEILAFAFTISDAYVKKIIKDVKNS